MASKTPWFMHCHGGHNTLVGVYPTPVGVYVRSYARDFIEVSFYPLDYTFDGGEHRECFPIIRRSYKNQHSEDDIDAAVAEDPAQRMEPAPAHQM